MGMPDQHAHVELDLLLQTAPLAGTFRCGADGPRPFVGWLELAALLEGVGRITPTPAPEPGDVEDSQR